MKLIFLGAPGSGKGTYASRVGAKLSIPQISTGELLRQEIKKETAIGKRAEIYVKNADWAAPEINEIVNELIKRRISEPDAKNGFIFDGYPRNQKQAQDLERISGIDHVINIKVPEEVLIRRITSRRTCRKCGKIYNISTKTLKPKKDGICDDCSGELYQRADETIEMTKKRMEENKEYTEPVIQHYKKKGLLIDVEWDRSLIPKGENDVPPEAMVNKILKSIKNT